MNSYITKFLLPDLLVMGKVGVLVDAPRVVGNSAADVPEDFRPYLTYYPIEHVETLVDAPNESASDYQAVILRNRREDFETETATTTSRDELIYYYLDPDRNNLVTIQVFDDTGNETQPPIETNLDKIPFVLFDINGSLMRDVCSYQIRSP